MSKLMKVVGSTPGVAHYAALSGLNVVTNASNSNNGTIYIQLKPWDERSSCFRAEGRSYPDIVRVLVKSATPYEDKARRYLELPATLFVE